MMNISVSMGYIMYIMGAVYTTIILKNKVDTIVSTLGERSITPDI
jgi:hypothetical protein